LFCVRRLEAFGKRPVTNLPERRMQARGGGNHGKALFRSPVSFRRADGGPRGESEGQEPQAGNRFDWGVARRNRRRPSIPGPRLRRHRLGANCRAERVGERRFPRVRRLCLVSNPFHGSRRAENRTSLPAAWSRGRRRRGVSQRDTHRGQGELPTEIQNGLGRPSHLQDSASCPSL